MKTGGVPGVVRRITVGTMFAVSGAVTAMDGKSPGGPMESGQVQTEEPVVTKATATAAHDHARGAALQDLGLRFIR